MNKKSINYEGVQPLFWMCLNDPDLWNDHYGWLLEETAPVWEKLNIPSKKTKKLRKTFTSQEKFYMVVHEKALLAYTKLVHLYDSLSEEEKNRICHEYNIWSHNIKIKVNNNGY